MSKKKMNTIFIMIIMVLITTFSVGYSALSQNLMISGDVAYYYNSKKLYDVLKNEVNRNTGYAREYTGAHQDSMSGTGSQKIYHWYASNSTNATAILNKNNVIFANHCWQMYRTTDTGGVKLIYNGEPENNQCLNTRGSHVGYSDATNTSLNTTYYYGTSYTYDKTNSVFSLSGTITTGEIKTGQYTCKSTTSDGTCSTLYLVHKYNGSDYDALKLTGSSNYSQFGKTKYNIIKGNSTTSPSDVGYMYNKKYYTKSLNHYVQLNNGGSFSINNNYYYSNSVTYNSSNYTYTLTNPNLVSSLSDTNDLVGKYYASGTSSTTIYYVIGINNNMITARRLWEGDLVTSIVIGDTYTDNGNGTYTINNPSTVKYEDWYSGSYSNYNDKYFCDGTSATCSNLKHMSRVTQTEYKYWGIEHNYKYSSTVSFDNGNYTLTGNIITMWDLAESNNSEQLSTHHYTCLDNTTTCTNLKFVFEYTNTSDLHYVVLTNENDMNTALITLFSANNVNKTDSTIKYAIDLWYKKNMLDYSNQLEDVIFCNDRSISSLGGWDPNGGIVTGNSTNKNLYFKNQSNSNSDLSCTNNTDKFSISNPKASLTYSVGLMTLPEANKLGNSSVNKTGQNYWLISPSMASSTTYMRYTTTSGSSSFSSINQTYGVRPVISLNSSTKYTSGDGSMQTPYIINDDIANTIFIDSEITNGTRNVTIKFPSGCSSGFTCSYKKNNGSSVTVTSSSVVVSFNSVGTLTTSVSDGDTTLTNSHTVKFNALYVSSSGNDSTGYGTIAAPYKTLEKAFEMSEKTSIIYIMNNITRNDTFTLNGHKNITLTSCTKSSNTSCPTSTANSIIRGSSLTSNVICHDNGTLTLSTITIDGNNVSADSPMIYTEGTLNINSGATIKNANTSSNGGAILNDEGTININGGTITNNTGHKGAGIFNLDGILNLNSGTISYNNSQNYVAGGIWTSGTFNMTGGSIDHNVGHSSGGVHCTYSSTICNMTMSGGSISYNETTNGHGGGLLLYSNDGNTPEAKITGGEFTHNKASLTTSEYAGGGAINNNGKLTIDNCNINNNEAFTGGGGIQNTNILIINNASITYNTAGYGGGINNTANSDLIGKITINNVTISNNTTTTANGKTGHGGGIMTQTGTLDIKGGTISSNHADNSGGGIFQSFHSESVTYQVSNTSYGKVKITGGTISSNTANGSGGGLYVSSNSTHQSELTVSNSAVKIQNNTAINNGGGIATSEKSTLKISAGTISGNKATTGNGYGGGIYTAGNTTISGGTITTNTARTYGGGWFLTGTSTSTMSSGTISNNTATENLAGGIRLNGELTLSGGTISGNKANTNGGGISIHSDGKLTMSGGTITNNQANSSGGIHNVGTFTMTGGTIGGSSSSAGNKATSGQGGGITNTGTATINQASGKTATIRYNSSTNSGGGIYNNGGTLYLKAGTISNNSGSYGGGVMAADVSNTKTYVQGITITANTATNSGGGIYAHGTLSITSGTIGGSSSSAGNTAGTYGGGLICKNTCTMSGGTIQYNKANNGGGISIDGTFTLSGGNIKNNSATTSGGGIFKGSNGTYNKSGSPSCSGNNQSGLTSACVWSSNN